MWALVALLLLTLSGVGLGAPPTLPRAGSDFVQDEVLVKFATGIDPVRIAQEAGARIHRRIGSLPIYVLKVPRGMVGRTISTLSRSSVVEFAEPNGFLYALGVPNDPYITTCYPSSDGRCTTQWAWGVVHAYEAWDVATGSTAVRVAVVDTGIDVGDPNGFPPDEGHEDLTTCQSIIAQSFISGESGNDDNGHGTHIAGTIGACTNNATGVAGANWAVQLMGVKVLDFFGSGTDADVAAGIAWAADNGARVINLSLGGGPSSTLQAAVDYAWGKGAVLACAAGNNGTTDFVYPAAYPNCIAVAATDENDVRAPFSTYGTWVSVGAPGVHILSTMQDNFYWCFLCWGLGYFPTYDSLSGTSMATAFVSGLAALIWARGLCTTNACVRSEIETTADPVAGTGTYWRNG
ncbi:MAG TPA: S8 family peptidase, partial [Candidatus Acidoferrales bacterium]|nr:S8 family peptidase [Candidatus Acidoferrales bacterium]